MVTVRYGQLSGLESNSLRNIICTAFLLIFLIVGNLPITASAEPDSGTGGSTVSVSVSVDPLSYQAHPGPNGDFKVTVHAAVSVVNPWNREIDFIPRLGETEWRYSVSQSYIVFNPADGRTTIYYDYYLIVPSATHAQNYFVYAYGEWKFKGSTTWQSSQGSRFTVSVNSYHAVGFSFKQHVWTLKPGKAGTISFDLINTGNGQDDYKIDFKSRDLTCHTSSSRTGVISPGCSYSINVDVTAPSSTKSIDYAMDLSVTSVDDGNLSSTVLIRGYMRDKVFYLAAGIGSVLYLQPMASSILSFEGGKGSVDIRIWSFLGASDNTTLQYRNLQSSSVNITPARLDIENGGYGIFHLKVRNCTTHDFIELYAVSDQSMASNTRHIPIVNRESSEMAWGSRGQKVAVTAAGIGAITLLGAALYANENWRYGLLIFLIPLYTRIDEEEVLNHFVRGRIYEHIKEHSGIYYSQLKRDLKLSNGELAYHLRVLTEKDMIKSEMDGRLKRLYVVGVKVDRDIYRGRSLKVQILNVIRNNPGITQGEIAKKIVDRKPRTVMHYVKTLQREGAILLIKVGKYKKCFLPEQLEDSGKSHCGFEHRHSSDNL